MTITSSQTGGFSSKSPPLLSRSGFVQSHQIMHIHETHDREIDLVFVRLSVQKQFLLRGLPALATDKAGSARKISGRFIPIAARYGRDARSQSSLVETESTGLSSRDQNPLRKFADGVFRRYPSLQCGWPGSDRVRRLRLPSNQPFPRTALDLSLITGQAATGMRGVDLIRALARNCGNQSFRCQGRSTSDRNREASVPKRSTGTDRPVRAMKAGNAAGAKGSGQAATSWVQLATGGNL